MKLLVLLFLIGCGSSVAYYSGYEALNLDEGKESLSEENGTLFYTRVLVECPVCEETGHWMPSNEKCSIVEGQKQYKRCELRVYNNKVCGNRLDCYRGPGEQCTVKRNLDIYGQKCVPGYYCNKPLEVCQGMDNLVDSRIQYLINPIAYSLKRTPEGVDIFITSSEEFSE